MATSLQQKTIKPTPGKIVKYTSDNLKYATQNCHTA